MASTLVQITMDSRQTQDTFLVTGNIKNFPIKPFIVTQKNDGDFRKR